MDPFLGEPALLTALEEGAAKGTLVASRPRYVREEHGPDAYARVAAALDADARAAFEHPPLPFTWTAMPTLVAIDRAIVEHAMGGSVERMRRFGALIARYDLPVVYRVLFRVGTPSFVIGRLGMAYAQYLRGGRMSAERGADTAHLVLRDFVQPRYLCAHGICGWLEAALEMSGGSNIRVEHTSCVHQGATQCEWDASWT